MQLEPLVGSGNIPRSAWLRQKEAQNTGLSFCSNTSPVAVEDSSEMTVDFSFGEKKFKTALLDRNSNNLRSTFSYTKNQTNEYFDERSERGCATVDKHGMSRE